MSSQTQTPNAPAGGLREQKKREKQARILREARRLFEQKGFDGTTAREICHRAGIGTGTLFLYVRDKRELLFLIFRDEAQRLYREGADRVRTGMTLPDAMMCLFGGFIEFYAQNPELSRVIARELFFQEHAPEHMGALTLEFGARIAGLVTRAQQRGELRSDIGPDEAVSSCFAHYAFWLQSWLGAKLVGREEVEHRLRRALVLQLEGLSG